MQVETLNRRRQAHRSRHQRRNPGSNLVFPNELAALPIFSVWLQGHVRSLREQEFPLEEKLIQLSVPSSSMAESYSYMWAYGALFRCNLEEDATSHATYDCGVCTLVSERDPDSIEVGILKNILRISFSGWNMIIMKIEWLKHEDEGRSSLKKESMGFWTCKFTAREDRCRINSFLYPVNANQVFFIEDVLSPGWKIILRHEPRGRRVGGTCINPFNLDPNSDVTGNEYSTPATTRDDLSDGNQAPTVARSLVQELELHLNRDEDDAHTSIGTRQKTNYSRCSFMYLERESTLNSDQTLYIAVDSGILHLK